METKNATNSETILKNVGICIVPTMTKPSRPGKQPRPVWNITGETNRYEHLIYDLSIKVKKWQGVLSCWEDPTDELAERIASEGAMSFAERKEYEAQRADARADRLEARADKQNSIANSAYAAQKRIANMIPLGQPILVGHHSEKRHRRDLDKIDRNMRTYIESSRYAKRLVERAQDNRERAAQNYTLEYIGNRLEEAKKALRDTIRKIEGKGCYGGREYQETKPATGEWLETLKRRQADYEEQIAYWNGLIKAKGGVLYSKENVKVGDWVYHIGWHRVFRVNKKTVSLRFFQPDQGWTNACEYYDIKAHCPREKAIAYGKQFGINLDKECKTTLDLKKA